MKTDKRQVVRIALYIQAGVSPDKSPLDSARHWVGTLGLRQWRGWFEPFPGLGPQRRRGGAQGFQPWADDWPEISKMPELAEVRLGGRLTGGGYGSLHIVQDEDGPVRWFVFSEQEFAGSKRMDDIEKIKYPVLPRKDAERRFFEKSPDWLDERVKLELVEYWQARQLLAWLVAEKR